jgi:ribosome biogenesis GTPase A
MTEFWKAVNRVIEEADILIEVLDARNAEQTRNKEIENKIKKAGKKIIVIANKSDLVENKEKLREAQTKTGAIIVSATKYSGMHSLKERIIIEGKRMGLKKPKVGVLGYPNVGKSSVINALKGKASAPVSAYSGFTKGIRNVSAKRFMLIDTPGVMPYKENTGMHATIGALDFSKIKDPELAVFEIMNENPGIMQNHYETKGEYEEFIEEFAKKRHLLTKGAVPDTKRAATTILRDWQTGKIKIK